MRGHRTDWSGSGDGQVAAPCECGNEPSGSNKMQGISWLAKDMLASQGLFLHEDLLNYNQQLSKAIVLSSINFSISKGQDLYM